MRKTVAIHRLKTLPGMSVFDPRTRTLVSAGNGDGTGGTTAYEYAFGSPADLIWIVGYAYDSKVSASDLGGGGDARFSGLYVVEDVGSNLEERNWRLRRHDILDSTVKCDEFFRDRSMLVLMDDPSNPGPTTCEIWLPPYFQLYFTDGPQLSLSTFSSPNITGV